MLNHVSKRVKAVCVFIVGALCVFALSGAIMFAKKVDDSGENKGNISNKSSEICGDDSHDFETSDSNGDFNGDFSGGSSDISGIFDNSDDFSDSDENKHEHVFVKADEKVATCESDGYVLLKCACGEQIENRISAKGHIFNLNASDFITVCECENCGKITKSKCADGAGLLKNKIDFDFENELNRLYLSLSEKLLNAESDEFADDDIAEKYSEFISDYNELTSLILTARETYLNAYVLSCVDKNFEYKAEKAREIYDRYQIIGFKLLNDVKNLPFGGLFFTDNNGFSESGINSALNLANIYARGGEYYSYLLNEIEETNEEIERANAVGLSVNNLYYKKVEINRKIAELFGYVGNSSDERVDGGYAEYAYKNLYRRDYAPRKTSKLIRYAKKYLVPLFKRLISDHNEKFSSVTPNGAVYRILNDSVFTSSFASGVYSNFLKTIYKAGISDFGLEKGGTCFEVINSAFKKGKILSGETVGAFTLKTSGTGDGIIYLGKGDGQNVFSLAHECGHYYCGENAVYSLPLDTAETAACMNEALFLVYLTGNGSPLSENEKTRLENEKLIDFLSAALASIVFDDFEQSVYVDYYFSDDCAEFTDGIKPADYGVLFKQILKDYGLSDYISENYWRFAASGDSFYNLSYEVAACSALAFYNDAKYAGFEKAAENYFDFVAAAKQPDATNSGVFLCAEYFSGATDRTKSLKSLLSEINIGYFFDESFYGSLCDKL